MGKFVPVLLVLILQAVPVCAAELHLSVAASLKEPVSELVDLYHKRYAGVTFKKIFGASGTLARQIEAGAPGDLFVSANNEWVEYLVKKKLADGKSVEVFAYNQLVVVGKPDLKITGMQDLLKLHRIAIGSPKSVPAGEYALAALKKSGLADIIGQKLVLAKDVREALQYANRGEVDAAFVYKTDALLLTKKAKMLYMVPQQLHERITYQMVLTTNAVHKPEALAFIAFLGSPEAKVVLKKHGFEVR